MIGSEASEGIRAVKAAIRSRVWDLMATRGVARFPSPPHGRIPNFRGAEEAALRLSRLEAWRKASVVKVNPDSPQREVRRLALMQGKVVVMPTPRVKSGFLVLDPSYIPRGKIGDAATIRGAFSLGKPVRSIEDLCREVRRIDLVVEGSVAVNRFGERLGKGEGYAELEYAILRELGILSGAEPVATTVHDLQVLDQRMPQEEYDVPVDIIVTPTRVMYAERLRSKPRGILWEKLSARKISEIPLLSELKRRRPCRVRTFSPIR